MSLIKVEVLVSAQDSSAKETSCKKFDVITIQPAGFGWGRGDLTGRFIFVTELDVPCGSDWKVVYRCSSCPFGYQNIKWDKDPPSNGEMGYTNDACPIQRLGGADVNFEAIVELDKNLKPVLVGWVTNLKHKNIAKIEYDKILTVDPQTITKIEADSKATLISEAEKNLRLADLRNISKEISSIELKEKSTSIVHQ